MTHLLNLSIWYHLGLVAGRGRRFLKIALLWLCVGTAMGMSLVLLLSKLVLSRQTSLAPGDGILVMLLAFVLIPLGGVCGLIKAATVWDKRRSNE